MSIRRRHTLLAAVAIVALGIALFVTFFDWNWLRHPLERYVTKKTQRVFRIDDLHVSLGWNPVVRMRNLYFENAAWSTRQPMAKIGQFEFSISLSDLWHSRTVIPNLSITNAQVSLERTADGRKNWLLSDPNDRAPSRLKILTLGIHGATVAYADEGTQFNVSASDVGLDAPGLIHSNDPRFQTRIQFKGEYHAAPFSGEVLTSSLLSFQETEQAFPLLGHLNAGQTKLDVDGTVTNLVELSAIDAVVKIEGATLANLYPFLLLPLPASPHYTIQGKLDFRGSTYHYAQFNGKIGTTDIEGDANYLSQKPRPLLHLTLHSRQMDLADLGPLVGVQTESGSGKAAVSAALGTREQAALSEHAKSSEKASDKASDKASAENGERLLPSGTINPERLRVLDADVQFSADQLKAPIDLPFDSLKFSLKLEDALLTLDPVEFGFGGGTVLGRIVLNGKSQPIDIQTDIRAKRIDLGRLVPTSPRVSPSQGKIGASVHLAGEGDSIATALSNANGYARAAISGGQISNLADAAVGLNGGKVLDLLVTGDKTIAVRCGAVDLEFAQGIGQAKTLVLDTDQTQILGSGDINLRDERVDFTLSPKPKETGILSLRAPIRIYGTFKHPDYSIDKTVVAARVGGAVVLGILSPFAALLPLLETGPGEDSNCHDLLQTDVTGNAAVRKARNSSVPPTH